MDPDSEWFRHQMERESRENDIVLSQEAWDKFMEALDAPPRVLPKLLEMFRKARRIERNDNV